MTAAKGVFITGTDTDVGKTTFAAALCYALASSGCQSAYYKPVLSGAVSTAQGLVGEDLVKVHQTAYRSKTSYLEKVPSLEKVSILEKVPCQGTTPSLMEADGQMLSSYLFEEAVSPHLAAKRQGQAIDISRLQSDFSQAAAAAPYLVVEGAGGAACPICDEPDIYTMAHLMAAFKLPVAVVCRAKLGTLHHTASTIAYLKAFDLNLKGLLVSGADDSFVCQDNLILLTKMTGLPILATLPQLASPCSPEAIRAAVNDHWDCPELIRRMFE